MQGQDVVFEQWLADMHPRLSRFRDLLMPPSWDGDWSRDSLAGLEADLLRRWPDDASFLADPDTDLVDGAVRYVGETLLRSCGGGWSIDHDPAFVFTGRPFVRLDTADATPISPFHLLTAALHRRTGTVLTKVLDAQTRRVADRRAAEGAGWEPVRAPMPGMTDAGPGAVEGDDSARWVAGLPGLLARLPELVGPDVAGRLDGGEGSLAAAEETALACAEDVAAGGTLHDALVAVVGETFRQFQHRRHQGEPRAVRRERVEDRRGPPQGNDGVGDPCPAAPCSASCDRSCRCCGRPHPRCHRPGVQLMRWR